MIRGKYGHACKSVNSFASDEAQRSPEEEHTARLSCGIETAFLGVLWGMLDVQVDLRYGGQGNVGPSWCH